MDSYEDEEDNLLKENYISSKKKRFYVRPPNQKDFVLLEDKHSYDVVNWLKKAFLPQGYPNSVSKDYIGYQIWDTAQAFCSTIAGILATQEVLRGVGVGDMNITPLAATITWVIKDGCGHIGKIWFAFTHGSCLDAYSKKWRLYADTLNDAAMCIEMALPMFEKWLTLALCVSSVIKAIVGVAGGATRLAMTQHHAVRGNMADVSAKDSAQETAVNLIASFTALLIISVFGNSLFMFACLIVLHIIFNYMAVRAVCLKTLNEPRFLQLIDTYLKTERMASPCEINRSEPILLYQMGLNMLDSKLCGFHIKLGCSLKEVVHFNSGSTHLKDIVQIYRRRNYILCPQVKDRKMIMLIKNEATVDDILCAYFHAVLLSMVLCAINRKNMDVYAQTRQVRPFAEMCHTLQKAHWAGYKTTRRLGFKYEPTYELMTYIDEKVQKEWRIIRRCLQRAGWDLHKHLLIVDEWRMSTLRSEILDPNVSVIRKLSL